MKFKAGDLIRVLTFEELMKVADYSHTDGVWRHPTESGYMFEMMTSYCGREMTIRESVDSPDGLNNYTVELSWIWADWMIVKVE